MSAVTVSLRHRFHGRFMFTPPWHLTRCGFIGEAFRLRRGCDEWHNKSRYLVVPLVGMFVWFATADRAGEEHVFAYMGAGVGRGGVRIPAEFSGRIVDGCDLCAEFVEGCQSSVV